LLLFGFGVFLVLLVLNAEVVTLRFDFEVIVRIDLLKFLDDLFCFLGE